MAGPTWRDPWTVPAPLRGPEPAKPFRVALVVDPAGQGTAKQVQDGVRKAARALEDAGYAVDEVEPPSIDAAAKTPAGHAQYPRRAGGVAPCRRRPADTRRFLSAFSRRPAIRTRDHRRSFVVRQSLLRPWGEFQETHPLIVAPIYTDVPFEVGTDLDAGRVPDDPRHADGHRRQRARSARSGASRGYRRTVSRRSCR